jgi:hypothetical protein
VARQPSGTGSAAESSGAPLEDLGSDALDRDSEPDVLDPDDDEDEIVDEDEADDEEDESVPATRSAETDAFWTDVRLQPIEIALPKGVGYTLRAYRLSTEVSAPEVGDREDDYTLTRAERESPAELDEDDERAILGQIDEDELTAQALAAPPVDERRSGRHRADGEGETERDDEIDDELDTDAEVAAADEAADEAVEDEAVEDEDDDAAADEAVEDEAEEPEEVPVFLAEGGKLLLFQSPEALVEYVRSDAGHELRQLDTWEEVRDRIEPDDVVPLDEDRYELDLVVENLRGGHDVWDGALIIQAGEVARDIGYALRLPAVISALAPGSPLDDLDEGLRSVEAGGFGSFFARRKLRKIDPQTTAALGWRTIIGKISAVVDWRN